MPIVLQALVKEQKEKYRGDSSNEQMYPSFGAKCSKTEYSEAKDDEKLENLTVNELKKIMTTCCKTSRGKRSVSTNKRRSMVGTSNNKSSSKPHRSTIRGSIRYDNI